MSLHFVRSLRYNTVNRTVIKIYKKWHHNFVIRFFSDWIYINTTSLPSDKCVRNVQRCQAYSLIYHKNLNVPHITFVAQQQKCELHTETVNWHASKYNIHKLYQRYFLKKMPPYTSSILGTSRHTGAQRSNMKQSFNFKTGLKYKHLQSYIPHSLICSKLK